MPIASSRLWHLKRWDVGAAAGVLGILVPAIGLFVLPIWDFPDTAASGVQIVAFVEAHRSALQTMMALTTVGVSLWLVFGARVRVELKSSADQGDELSTYFGVGLVSFVTLLLAGFAVFDVLVYRTPGRTEAQILYDLAFGLLAMSGMPTAIALVAYAVAVYRRRRLPVFTAHLALITAALHLTLLLSFVIGTGFWSLEGEVITVVPALLWAWILATALTLARTHRVPTDPSSSVRPRPTTDQRS